MRNTVSFSRSIRNMKYISVCLRACARVRTIHNGSSMCESIHSIRHTICKEIQWIHIKFSLSEVYMKSRLRVKFCGINNNFRLYSLLWHTQQQQQQRTFDVCIQKNSTCFHFARFLFWFRIKKKRKKNGRRNKHINIVNYTKCTRNTHSFGQM